MQKQPRLMRPYRAVVLAIAPLLKDDAYLEMTEVQFVGAVMKATGGSASPSFVAEEYRKLIAEAGY